MRIIQILNSIKLPSLKCLWFSLGATTILLSTACNRKPDACIEVNPITVQLGEKLTISDCTTLRFNNEIKTGEGGSFSDIESMVWSYSTPGSYFITLRAFSKRGNKSDEILQQVRVYSPDSLKVYGKWNLYSIELREQLFVDPSINIFENELIETDTLDEDYTLRGDSIFIKHHRENFNLYLNEYEMKYDQSKATIKIGEVNYEIASFTDDEMIWKGSYFKGYSLLYLRRI